MREGYRRVVLKEYWQDIQTTNERGEQVTERILIGQDIGYEPVSAQAISEDLRARREKECFAICDRACWYDSLEDWQKEDIKRWRKEWLDAPETRIEPIKPFWLK